MAEFDEAREELGQAREAYRDAVRELAQARMGMLRAERERLDEQASAAREEVERAQGARAEAVRRLKGAVELFEPMSDPRKELGRLDDDYPCLLFPLRIETRFKPVGEGTQLWVRVFPDTCLIDTFEPSLAAVELESARAYWRGMWRAGGVEADERAAWRALVASHGSGRAAWIADNCRPEGDPAPPVKADETDVILVVSTPAALPAAERPHVATFWRAHWRADGAAAGEQAARDALDAAVGAPRAAELAELTRPYNIADRPAAPLGPVDVASSVEFVVLPDAPVQDQPWSHAPEVNLLPDRLVLILEAGEQRIERLGEPVPSPLIVGPDPLAPAGEQLHLEDGELAVPDELRWMADFERAVEVGLGFKVDLNAEQARRGFDRLMVLGVRLSGDEQDGSASLETLLDHHHHGRAGLSLVPQGTPTNNTEGVGAGFTRAADADATFDDRRLGQLFTTEADPRLKRDGQWLAESLGIHPDVLARVAGSGGFDQRDARAMQTALWPATLGYFLETMMDPLVDDDDVEHTRWFFTRHVRGRGQVPAIRIGNQPYGILPTTAFSRIGWLGGDEPDRGERRGRLGYLRRLHGLLREADEDWAALAREVPAVSRPGDPYQTLLGILGLHPGSAEFHYRYAESLDHLYNHLNLLGLGVLMYQLVLRARLDAEAMALLAKLGVDGERPAVLDRYFLSGQGRLQGPLVDDRPLSETEGIRAWTTDERNYLSWLADVGTSLETLRSQAGFIDGRPPIALLYLLLRHALILGYSGAGRALHRTAGFDEQVVSALKREPAFVHVDAQAPVSESRWQPLYKVEPAITVGGTETVAEYIASVLGTASETTSLREQLEAIGLLEEASTARLERALVEHIDCCTYRFDAWLLGLVNLQLETMREARGGGDLEGDGHPARRGVHLGAYGWLEEVRPRPRALSPVELPADLAEDFGGAGRVPLMRDDSNGGYIHAPSLNQAVTAAVLRSGYLANATPGAPDAMAVNLSSERVRLAMRLLEGIRNGQSLASLLGYRLERGLHDRHAVAEVDQFVFALRKQFPLRADRLAPTSTPPGVSIEAIEASNVMDGLRFVEHMRSTGSRSYPFGLGGLPSASDAQRQAIDAEADALLDLYDALADLALAEGVHQAVQGNFDRVAGTLAAYTTGSHPPEPDVVRTPAVGVTLTHRVGLHLEPGLAAPGGATPRAIVEPALNAWLAGVLPPLGQIACRVRWRDPVTNAPQVETVTMSQLGLQPLDLIELVRTEEQQAMTELDDRVMRRVLGLASPRPDVILEIRYMEHGANQLSVFEVAPLVARLRSLVVAARPLSPTDLEPPATAAHEADAGSRVDPARITAARAVAAPLPAAFDAYLGPLDAMLADLPNRRQDVLDSIDALIDDAATLLARAARFGVPQTGWGFALTWRRDTYAGVIKRLRERVARWDTRFVAFEDLLDVYDNLDPATPLDERFNMLRQAESLVSTTPVEPLPDDPAGLRAGVGTKGTEFEARRDALDAVAKGAAPGLADLLAALSGGPTPLLPLTAFDSEPFELGPVEEAVLVVARELSVVLTGVRNVLAERVDTAQDQLDAHDAAGEGPARLDALRLAAEALLGEGVALVPEFELPAGSGDALEDALAETASGELLKYLVDEKEIQFPVDEWMYGVARVRAPVRHVEQTIMLAEGFGRAEPVLVPAQLPHRAGERWLALEYPPDQEVDAERLLFTGAYTVPFDKAAPQCGLLIDEWTEVVPGTSTATGIAFHYDKPNAEAPQSLLLVTPAAWDGAWHWEDLVEALRETLELARKRAVEPAQLDATAYARFLPATITAATRHAISISMVLAANNKVFQLVESEGPDG